MTESRYEEYSEELREALEIRDVPVHAADRIVREVESHLLESGEDPVVSFGRPGEYADQFAPGSRRVWFWALIVSSVVLAGGGAYVLISGVFGVLSPSPTLWDLTPWARITLGALGIAGFCALILAAAARSRRRSSSWRIKTD
ncbi:hypothetical protein [Arthrobacter sp. UYCu712]|uniref:hypothetical protein n=1 Tax=Arthrobacter sp. UYCu712 TaxID=3156340 RepID=UPI003397291C